MHPLCFYFIISKLYEPGVCSAFFRQSYLFSSLSVYIQATQLCFTDAKIAISYAKIKHNQNIFLLLHAQYHQDYINMLAVIPKEFAIL